MAKTKAEEAEQLQEQEAQVEKADKKEDKPNQLAKVLKSIGALSHSDRLLLYSHLNGAANTDRDKFSVGITDHDASGAFDEIIKSL